MNDGYRVRVTIESVTASDTDPTYTLVIDSSGNSILKNGDGTTVLAAPSGIHSIQTHETFQDQTCSLEMPLGAMGLALEKRILPNDFLSVEIAGTTSSQYHLAFLGLVDSITRSAQSTPNGIRTSLVLQAQGLKKFFRQSIYNWQGVLALGDDVRLGSTANQAYVSFCQSGYLKAPQDIIQGFVQIGVSNSISARVHNLPVKAGGLFVFGKGAQWSSAYPADMFPNTAATILSGQQGDLWSLFESMLDPDLHEFFWTYAQDGSSEKPALIHRPRPFPFLVEGAANAFSVDATGWNALAHTTLGKGTAAQPCAIGIMRQRSDAGRVNAFHWAQGFSNDENADSGKWKLTLGWWADKKSIAKYGFAPRGVGSQLIPLAAKDFMSVLRGLMLRVASQEAPLYLMGNESRTYGGLLAGVHIGHAVEDWTEGTATTGYVSSVSHVLRWDPQSLQANSTVGLSRCLSGTTFADYPAAAAALVSMNHVDYLQMGSDHPANVASRGAAGVVTVVGNTTSLPNAELVKAAAKRAGVPAWLVAAVYQKESGCGRSKKMGVDGPMQITSDAVTGLAGIGYTKEDGTAFLLADRINTQAALDAGAAYLAYGARLISCPTANTNYWGFVAQAYNSGVNATNTAGATTSPTWGGSCLSSYGSDVMGLQSTFQPIVGS